MVALSLIFYAYCGLESIPILIGSILINWLSAKYYAYTKNGAVISLAIGANLIILGLLKYNNFVFANILHITGVSVNIPQMTLPLGISFFTFHHVMYLVDLRRGRAPTYSLGRYALYICFFPQAIAGPLARWHEVMHQFGDKLVRPGWERRCALGATFVVVGLAEKILLGDGLARELAPIFARAEQAVVLDGSAWMALAAGFQVFFDFAGYSDIAIGLALIFGVELPRNFDGPFRATSIQQLWQRWHMTLSRFLRDYLFFSLARIKYGRARFRVAHQLAAVLITMALCGLWHGAGWNFVIWGILQGLALIFAAVWSKYLGPVPSAVGWVATIGFFLTSGILFRAGSVGAALNIYQGLTVAPAVQLISTTLVLSSVCATVVPASHVVCRWLTRRPQSRLAIALGLAGALLLTQLGGDQNHEFVYFRF